LKNERGVTLIEMLVGMLLTAMLLALSAGAARTYWLNQALSSAQGQIVSQLRQTQEQVVSETHPTVYGVRFRVGSSDWGVVAYDPTITGSHPAATCTQVRNNTFATGVTVTAASFAAPTDTTMANLCKAIPGAATDAFVYFYARGSATGGSVTVTQPSLGRSEVVTVTPITGRAEAN
jgi:prepilin-type N-terminal cleavage/methylation domain-containing protein